jgi:hypothetical protein
MTSADENLSSDTGTDADDAAFDQVCYDLDLMTDTVKLEPTPLTRPEKILLAFYKERSDRILHYTHTMGGLPPSTSTDNEPHHTLPFIPEESDDDWDDHGNPTDLTPSTPPIPPDPPVSPSNVPSLSNPTNPPSLPSGNQTFNKCKQKLLNFFQNF